jgi:hypothetical protein
MRYEILPTRAAATNSVDAPTHVCLPARLHQKTALTVSALVAAMFLGACTPGPQQETITRASTSALELPGMVASSGGLTQPQARRRVASNAEIARDFVELSFNLESGRPIPRLSRFEGPVTIRTTGAVPASAPAELARLVSRLRAEANIDITASQSPDASITVEFVPRRTMSAAVPNAACFVVPNVTSWDQYKRARGTAVTDWAQVPVRTHATVFVPSDTAPQEVRDCLHEEVAQGLGPLNDLYRLPDSIFNDDNFNTTLTAHDMAVLKVYYARELHSGMTPQQVQALLPQVLARVNPAGGPTSGAGKPSPTPQIFVATLEKAMGPRASNRARQDFARQAVAMAAAQGWHDTRAGFAWFALGRLTMQDAPQTALTAFLNAGAIYRATPGAGIQAAHVDMQLAKVALANGRAQEAIQLVNRSTGAALENENPALMATLLLIRAEAYEMLGNDQLARQARLDSASWARYGFGSDAAVRQRSAEVAALANTGSRRN